VDADRTLRIRTSGGKDLRLRPGAVVVAAGCGTKPLLGETFGIDLGVLDGITYSKVHMVCLRASAGILPELGAIVAPELFVAERPHREAEPVT
jgi:hypothetical protein